MGVGGSITYSSTQHGLVCLYVMLPLTPTPQIILPMVKHAQLRMKCGSLSGHLYDLHVVDLVPVSVGLTLKILITSSLIVRYLEPKEQNY